MFKKVSDLLESKEITKEAAEVLDSEIGSALTKLRDENKTLRTEKEDLSRNYDEILTAKKGLDVQLSGLDEKIAQAKKDGEGSIVKELEAERAKQSDLVANFENLQKANRSLTIDSGVQRALSSFDVIDTDVVSVVLKQSVTLDDAGKLQYGDGMSVEEGFKTFFDAKPHLLKAQGNPGSGAGNNGGSGNVPKQNFGGTSSERTASIQAMIDANK